MLGVVAFEAVAVHVARGTLTWDLTLARSGAVAVGAILGAQVGARFSHRVGGERILRLLGAALLLVAARLAWTALA